MPRTSHTGGESRATGAARPRRLIAVASAALLIGTAAASGQGPGMGMPDPSQMSGVPLPAADLPNGAVSVRVVRGSIANNLPDQPVELHGGPGVLTERTDASGHVQFHGLVPGTPVHAVAVVEGTRLESQVFPVPAAGGVKVMLVAPDAAMQARADEDAKLAASPARPGVVVLTGQSQFVVELDDDVLQVYYLLQIANSARTPVSADSLVFNLPPGARNASILDGSSPLARASGLQITVSGPFPPGTTVVQATYQLPYRASTVTISQTLPAPLEQLSLAVQKAGATHVESVQLSSHGEMPAEGKTYLVGSGPAIPAGQALTFTLTGLPHRATWPRTLVLTLAALVLGAGIWAATSRGSEAASIDERRKTLETRRDRLFADLVRVEEQHRTGQIDDTRYGTRRRELVGQLERIYSELDQGLAA